MCKGLSNGLTDNPFRPRPIKPTIGLFFALSWLAVFYDWHSHAAFTDAAKRFSSVSAPSSSLNRDNYQNDGPISIQKFSSLFTNDPCAEDCHQHKAADILLRTAGLMCETTTKL